MKAAAAKPQKLPIFHNQCLRQLILHRNKTDSCNVACRNSAHTAGGLPHRVHNWSARAPQLRHYCQWDLYAAQACSAVLQRLNSPKYGSPFEAAWCQPANASIPGLRGITRRGRKGRRPNGQVPRGQAGTWREAKL